MGYDPGDSDVYLRSVRMNDFRLLHCLLSLLLFTQPATQPVTQPVSPPLILHERSAVAGKELPIPTHERERACASFLSRCVSLGSHFSSIGCCCRYRVRSQETRSQAYRRYRLRTPLAQSQIVQNFNKVTCQCSWKR